MSHLFNTVIADIRILFKSSSALLFKVRTGLVTSKTESTLDPTKKDFPAGIGLFTMVTVNAKVPGIIKDTFVIPVGQPVYFPSLKMVAESLQRKHAISLKEYSLRAGYFYFALLRLMFTISVFSGSAMYLLSAEHLNVAFSITRSIYPAFVSIKSLHSKSAVSSVEFAL